MSAPTAPTSISATTSRSDGIQVTWSGGSGATSYNVWRGTSSSRSSASKIKTGATSPYLDQSARAEGTAYYYWVEAANSAGSAYSSSALGKKVSSSSSTPSSGSLRNAVDNTLLAFTTDSGAGWSWQSSASHDGTDAAQSGVIAHKEDTWMQTTVPGPGTMTFWWKVSCEKGNWFDYLEVLVDGTRQDRIQGETEWTQVRLDITGSGPHDVTWNYHKDVSVSSGSDCGWVDQIAWADTVMLDRQGGSGGTSSVKAAYGRGMPAISVPVRPGYTFGGYYSEPGGSGTAYYTASGVSARTWNRTGVARLYAKWKPTTYQVVYRANGGTGSMKPQGMTYGKGAKLRANAFRRTGYTFLGWSTRPTGGIEFGNLAAVKNLRTDGGTTTLHALWAKNNYQVAFHGNGGTGTMRPQPMVYGRGAQLRSVAFRRTGYTFEGWATTPTGTAVYGNRKAVKNLRRDGGTARLYAKWKPTVYRVVFDANGGTGTMSPQPIAYDQGTQLRGNFFKRAGYTFLGWSTKRTGGIEYGDRKAVKNLRTDGGTVTLHALWAKTKYHVEFLPNNGTGTMGAQTLTYGQEEPLRPNAFQRRNHDFIGWATTAKGRVAYPDGAVVKNLRRDGGTVTLYARWQLRKTQKKVERSRAPAVTTSDGSDGSAVADGDEGTGWSPEGAGPGAWVVLSLAEAREVAGVEVTGEKLPEGMRVLLSEDAEEWFEGESGTARYVWVAFPEGAEGMEVREVRVVEESR